MLLYNHIDNFIAVVARGQSATSAPLPPNKEPMTPPPEPFRLDLPKLFETILYFLEKRHPLTRFDLSKMIYFADREHLFKFGTPITGDSFYAMEHGPVPSQAYDILKVVSGENNQFLDREVQQAAIENLGTNDDGLSFSPKRPPNKDYLSPSAMECLNFAFDKVDGRSFGEISDETHQHSGYKNLDPNDMLSFWDIIKDAENYEELKEYIEDLVDEA